MDDVSKEHDENLHKPQYRRHQRTSHAPTSTTQMTAKSNNRKELLTSISTPKQFLNIDNTINNINSNSSNNKPEGLTTTTTTMTTTTTTTPKQILNIDNTIGTNNGSSSNNKEEEGLATTAMTTTSTTTTPSQSQAECEDAASPKKTMLLDDVLSEIPLGRFHWRMLVLVGSGYFAVCSEMMLFIFLSVPVREEWDLDTYDFPWLPFSTGVAAIIGGYLAGVVSDKVGRRVPFLVGMLMVAVFGVTSALAPSFSVFIALRCMVTIGNGVFEAVGFVLLVEFLPRQRRGSLLVVVTLCGALGAAYAGGMAWLVFSGLGWGWRWFVGVCALPAIGVLVFQPMAFYETPRHLLVCGREEEAMRVLRAMVRINKSGPLPTTERIVCPVDKSSSRGNISRLFSKDLRWQTLVFTTLWFLESSGYWGVTMYLPEYMSSTLGVDSYLNMFSIFIGEIPGILLVMFLIEKKKLGRIGCLRIFSLITASSLLVFSFIPKHALKSVLIVLCYFGMVPIYSILNVFTPEVFPTDVRSTSMAWMNTVIEVPGLITPFVGRTLLSSEITWLYPLVWAAIFLVQFVVTFGLSLDSVGENLKDFKDSEVDREHK